MSPELRELLDTMRNHKGVLRITDPRAFAIKLEAAIGQDESAPASWPTGTPEAEPLQALIRKWRIDGQDAISEAQRKRLLIAATAISTRLECADELEAAIAARLTGEASAPYSADSFSWVCACGMTNRLMAASCSQCHKVRPDREERGHEQRATLDERAGGAGGGDGGAARARGGDADPLVVGEASAPAQDEQSKLLTAALRMTRTRDEHCWNCKIKDCAECLRLNESVAELRCEALGDVANPVADAAASPLSAPQEDGQQTKTKT